MIALTAASILACGGPGFGEVECDFDDECGVGEVCDDDRGVCVDTCRNDQDCRSGEACLPRRSSPNSGVTVCQSAPTTNNNNNNAQCVENEDCEFDELCINGTCTPTQQPQNIYRYIQIRDVSSGRDACEGSRAAGLRDPGSDIFSATLLSGTGEVIGYGLVVDFVQGQHPNDFTFTGFLDGSPPNLDESTCPAPDASGVRFRTDNVVALGCGGSLVLGFQGSNGQLVNIQNGMQIAVGEYASICNRADGSLTGADRYEVYVCTDTDSASNGNTSSCSNRVFGPVGGTSNGVVRGLSN
jgi:hypothetical protein